MLKLYLVKKNISNKKVFDTINEKFLFNRNQLFEGCVRYHTLLLFTKCYVFYSYFQTFPLIIFFSFPP